MELHQYDLFARSTAQSNKSSAAEGAVHELPSIEKITPYLVRELVHFAGKMTNYVFIRLAR